MEDTFTLEDAEGDEKFKKRHTFKRCRLISDSDTDGNACLIRNYTCTLKINTVKKATVFILYIVLIYVLILCT